MITPGIQKSVLDYFRSKPPNEELTLEQISKKLITLLALVTGHRMQTFSLIKLENIIIKDKSIVIKIPNRIKTSSRNRSQPLLILPIYQETKVCAASALIFYLQKTEQIRNSNQELFLSFRNPFKPVTCQTLSHWVKDTLNDSGIDTEVFTSHSTRHASTSAAKRSGIDIALIRKTAGWTKDSESFAKFYDKQIVTDANQFALSILQG